MRSFLCKLLRNLTKISKRFSVHDSLKLEIHLGLLPSEVRVGSTEVAKSGGLLINWSFQVELLNDAAGLETEIVINNLDKVIISQTLLYGAV